MSLIVNVSSCVMSREDFFIESTAECRKDMQTRDKRPMQYRCP